MAKFEVNKEDVLKELDMLQNCISRMSTNSFALKGWYVTVITALFAFIFTADRALIGKLLGVLIITTIVFWYLNSYYLLLERKYRVQYEWVLKNRVYSEEISTEKIFDLNVNGKSDSEINKSEKFLSAMFSAAFKLLYILPLAVEVLIFIFIKQI